MKLNILSAISIAIALLLTGCEDDEIMSGTEIIDDTESPLQFSVNSFTVVSENGSRSAEPSDNPEPETADEKKIENFWLFQFDTDGNQLVEPKYYQLATGQAFNDLTKTAYADLTPDTPMTLYVVTNVGENWTEAATLNTLQKVKEAKLPRPFPIRIISDEKRSDELLIPMSGQVDNVTKKDKTLIVVPVTRMYAKIKVKVDFVDDATDMTVYDVMVTKIPFYCLVAPDYKIDPETNEPAAMVIPEGTEMITRSFKSSDAVNGWITLYVPENLQGEVEGAQKQFIYTPPTQKRNVPEQALYANIRAKYNGMDYDFTIYPGENSTNNFNVRRNCVYRVEADVKSTTDQHKPSSNCYVVKPNSYVTFEPYYRVETGGGFVFSDYLDPKDETADDDINSKKIATTEIIWQTKNCIGDNTDGSLVKFTLNESDPIHSKLTVYTGEEGNALVGARNKAGKILWSWHIWVTPNEPDNFANAYVYTTYKWNVSGIDPNVRVPGYGIMPCNLGALAFTSGVMSVASISPGQFFPNDQVKTFGMLYQWGRKDPFPPMIQSTGTEDLNNKDPNNPNDTSITNYDDQMTGPHYGNDNKTEVHKTSEYDEAYLFHSKKLLERKRQGFFQYVYINSENPVKYGIAHPTVYISGTGLSTDANFNEYGGDWCGPDSDDKLWGGLPDDGLTGLKVATSGTGWNQIDHYIYNNYGEKSIFDPCPTGWRVPPGDLWMGFTSTGYNPTKVDKYDHTSYDEQINYDHNVSWNKPGMSMYVRGWQTGPTTYFPLQGTRQYNGRCHNPGLCGNYHNATCEANNKVNILHLHRDMDHVSSWDGENSESRNNLLFRIFEYTDANTAKSTASPVRCVRDSK